MQHTKKKAQMSISDAPSLVLIVGLTFLVMATVALIGQKYGGAIPSDNSGLVENETGFYLNGTVYSVNNASDCNFDNFAITEVVNSTDGAVLLVGNYTAGDTGTITNASTAWKYPIKVSYTYTYSGVACTINEDLETNISDNTSIAGIILTIALVGIVLTILIGVFIGIRRKTARV